MILLLLFQLDFKFHIFCLSNSYSKTHVQKYENFQQCATLHHYFKLLNIMMKHIHHNKNHFKLRRRSMFKRSMLICLCSAILIIYMKKYFIHISLLLLFSYYCIFFLLLSINLLY